MSAVGRWVACALTAIPILVLTLTPGRFTPSEELSFFCVICGWRGTSDAILNIFLFLPLGMAIGALGRTARIAFSAGLALSIGIELLQFVIPNRNPGLGDLIYNATGAVLGATLYLRRDHLVARGAPERARRFTRAWGLLGLALLAAQVWLLGPAIPDRGQAWEWTPITDYGTRYEADVSATSVDGEPLAAGRVPAGHSLFDGLRSRTDVRVTFEAADFPFGLAPLVRLRTDEGDDDLYIGLDYRDIIVIYRTRGMALRLDRPYPRWVRGARTWSVGDRIELRMSGIGQGIELANSGGSLEPGVDFEPGPDYDPGPVRITIPSARGWGFLMYPRWAARTAPAYLDFVWMFLLAVPLGFWGATATGVRFALGWIAALYLLPVAFPLVSASLHGALGVAAAIPFGLLLRFVQGNPEPFKWWKPLHTLYDTELAGEVGRAGGPPGGALEYDEEGKDE